MEEKKYLRLNDIESYRNSFHLSNQVWEKVIRWNSFATDTVGKQFVRSVDSISANIAEGFGRKGKRDKAKFYNYAYASVLESLDWNEKSKTRKLMTNEEYDLIFTELQKLPKQINTLIKFTNEKLKI